MVLLFRSCLGHLADTNSFPCSKKVPLGNICSTFFNSLFFSVCDTTDIHFSERIFKKQNPVGMCWEHVPCLLATKLATTVANILLLLFYHVYSKQKHGRESAKRLSISLSKVMAIFRASPSKYAVHIFSLNIILLWLFISIAMSVRHIHRFSGINLQCL